MSKGKQTNKQTNKQKFHFFFMYRQSACHIKKKLREEKTSERKT